MLFTFLLVFHAIIAASLVTVILMQRSEGGGLGTGGSPGGLMSARGHADFLTRSTAVLASLFVGLSIALAVIAATRQSVTVDPTLARRPPVSTAPAPVTTGPDAAAVAANQIAPAPSNTGNSAVPLAQ